MIRAAEVEARRQKIIAAANTYRDALSGYTDALRQYRQLATRDAQVGHPSLHPQRDTNDAASKVTNAQASVRNARDAFYAAIDACPVARWQLLDRYASRSAA